MGIFSAILDKLRGHGGASPQQQQQQHTPAGSGTLSPQAQHSIKMAQAGQAGQAAAGAPLQNVDIDAVLKQMAAKKGGGGNYRESIVDLLKLLDLDSSLEARKELAQELGVNAGAHGSAEQNIALHKAVMKKVAENGGKVPDSLKD
jgi:hypothetical protein